MGMLRSPKAHERRNMRKTIEMPIIPLARELLKSTDRSRTSGRGGRRNGKTKDKEQDHADTSLCACGQQPLVPVPCPTSLRCLLQGGWAGQTLDKDIGWDRSCGVGVQPKAWFFCDLLPLLISYFCPKEHTWNRPFSSHCAFKSSSYLFH